jgi:uncharacterized protein (DUF1697 family)
MATYIALLRGINVGGHKIIKMDQLRRSFEALGFKNVRTYVQSGNVIFEAAKRSPQKMVAAIERRILDEYGFEVVVIVRTAEEMSRAIEKNPFLREDGIDRTKLHVTFLSHVPARDVLSKLDAVDAGKERFCCLDSEMYLHLPNGAGESKLSITLFERVLSVSATSRNWNTVNKLAELASKAGT